MLQEKQLWWPCFCLHAKIALTGKFSKYHKIMGQLLCENERIKVEIADLKKQRKDYVIYSATLDPHWIYSYQLRGLQDIFVSSAW